MKIFINMYGLIASFVDCFSKRGSGFEQTRETISDQLNSINPDLIGVKLHKNGGSILNFEYTPDPYASYLNQFGIEKNE